MTAIEELIKDFELLKKTKLYEHSFKSIDDCIVLAYAALEKEKVEIMQWKYFLDNNTPLNDWEILVYSNKKNKYYLEYTDSEFFQRAINRNYIKWIKL